MPMKPADHYGREALQLVDAMREELEEDDDIPDTLVADVEETYRSLRAETEAARDIRMEVSADAEV